MIKFLTDPRLCKSLGCILKRKTPSFHNQGRGPRKTPNLIPDNSKKRIKGEILIFNDKAQKATGKSPRITIKKTKKRIKFVKNSF